MTSGISTIATPFMLGVTVNCHLIRARDGYILIDTGRARKRGVVEKQLEDAGCLPGHLKLIVLTHGDFDHCGNAAYLRRRFGGQIAMHEGDSGMVERGDMLWNRSRHNILVRMMFKLFIRLRKSDRFRPDMHIMEGYDFSGYGLDAKVLDVPGHSKGSIAVLTAAGDLFCGDLLANVDKPDVWSIIDDEVAASVSIEKLKHLQIKTVYPGHGRPFPMETFVKMHR